MPTSHSPRFRTTAYPFGELYETITAHQAEIAIEHETQVQRALHLKDQRSRVTAREARYLLSAMQAAHLNIEASGDILHYQPAREDVILES